MTNNLQANSLVKIYRKEFSSFIESEKIEFPKTNFKNISIGSWIKIDSKELKANYILDSRVNASCVLETHGSYLHADISLYKKSKIYKKNKNKDSFTIKMTIDKKIIQNSYIALSLLPKDVLILRGSKTFAYANLYYNGSFLLEIKEIL